MAPKKGGENTKKAAGNAKKAEVASQKKAAEDQKKAKVEDEEWSKGSKSSVKKEAAADKAAEAAKKKAEKAALLAQEEASQPSKPKGAGAKQATKKAVGPSKGTLDLGQLDASEPSNSSAALHATGIDNALDALSLTNAAGQNEKIDRHPERRFKAAYAAYEEKRLDEMKDEKGLRRQQKVDQIRKEFEKSPENPFNQSMIGRFDMSKDEMKGLRAEEREARESRLTSQQGAPN